MNSKLSSKTICICLEILVGANKSETAVTAAKNSTDAFKISITSNISAVLEARLKYPELQQLLEDYFDKDLLTESSRNIYWIFVEWCLIFMNLLKNVLDEEVRSNTQQVSLTDTPSLAGGILSITQQKVVGITLQFIVALGILPNLLPGVGIPLAKRSDFANVAENINVSSCPRTKHRCLIASLATLLHCNNQPSLRSLIISKCLGDLLAALFQLSHAPIKKVSKHKNDMQNQPVEPEEQSLEFASPASVVNQLRQVRPKKSMELMELLLRARDCSKYSEEQVINEMWEDRQYFISQFEELLHQTCPSLLICELLILQGTHQMKPKKVSRSKQCSAPHWLLKVCNTLFTKQLLKPQGIKFFLQTVMDKISDADLKAGTVSKMKLEAVARLISGKPFNQMPLELHVKEISDQVVDLMLTKGTIMDDIFSYVASFIIIQVANCNLALAESCFCKVLFRPLWRCMESTDLSELCEPFKIAGEEEIIICVEKLHKIFVLSRSPTDYNSVQLLLPYYHLIFTFFYQTQGGVSFLRPKLEDLLITFLNQSTFDFAVMLVRFVSFEDIAVDKVHCVNNLKCVPGDTGGIVIIRSICISSEELLDNVSKKCHSIIELLQKTSKKKLKIAYFLLLLKMLTDDVKENKLDDELKEVSIFQNKLVHLQLLQELAGTIGEDLLEDIAEAVHFIKITLERGIRQCPEKENNFELLDPETSMIALMILETLINYKTQLTSSHWKAMKECLPSLKKLATSSDDIVKHVSEYLFISIATHGAASDSCKVNKTVPTQKHVISENECKSSANYKKLAEEKLGTLFSSLKNPNSNNCKVSSTEEVLENISHPLQTKDKPVTLIESDSTKEQKDHQKSNCTDSSNQAGPEITKLCKEPSTNAKTMKTLYSTEDQGKLTLYKTAWEELHDSFLPTRGHALIALSHLIRERDQETLSYQNDLLRVFQEQLSDSDSYIYLSAIQGLSALAEVSVDLVLPVILSKFITPNSPKLDLQLKIGEVLLKICRDLGEMTVKYRDQFLTAYLQGTKHLDPQMRVSSLSNLSEVCKHLKFSIGPWLQEVLLCIHSLLKTDPELEVRRSAVLVITLLLRGAGKDAFIVLERELKDIYHLLKLVYNTTEDDVLKLHCQLALEEMGNIVKELLFRKPLLTKEIRVLDPF